MRQILVALALTTAALTPQPELAAQTIRQYRFALAGDGYELALETVPRPSAGPHEVLVRATSLNRRDVMMLNGRYGPGGAGSGQIPLSDGAGEVVAVGDGVRRLTGGTGVHDVLEVGGQDTLPRALQALAFDGHVALIGGLSGFAQDIGVGTLMGLGASVTGAYVGSREDFEAMNAFITEHAIRPHVDRVFDFEDAAQAFEFMENGSFFGKMVIRL